MPLVEAEVDEHFRTVLEWADELRRLGCAPTPTGPTTRATARRFGAGGIGLCRTEHMFIGDERQAKMREMIMADGEAERRAALAELEPLQRADFEGLFAEMAGLPVTIRLLDPPLHEFLPRAEELVAEIERRLAAGDGDVDPSWSASCTGCASSRRPTRCSAPAAAGWGCCTRRSTRCRSRAIVAAGGRGARARRRARPELEIMIPLVDYERELAAMRELVERAAAEAFERLGAEPLSFQVGTMIELPRACLVADRLAADADFFSFGTNDLTQTALGFSRDDSEGRFLSEYLRRKIVDRSPFETIDVDGVG